MTTKEPMICKETGKPFRWFGSKEVWDALTPEMFLFIQDDTKSSLWGSGLLLEIITEDHLCTQLLDIADLIRAKRAPLTSVHDSQRVDSVLEAGGQSK